MGLSIADPGESRGTHQRERSTTIIEPGPRGDQNEMPRPSPDHPVLRAAAHWRDRQPGPVENGESVALLEERVT